MGEASGTGAVLSVAGGMTLGGILTYFGISGEALTILSIMLMVDRVFGVINAYIQDNLQSKIMTRGLFKKGVRWCIPFVVVGVLRGAGFENVEMISTSILSILIVAEGYSIIGHIYSINYNTNLPEIDALKLLIERIAKLFKGELDKKNKE